MEKWKLNSASYIIACRFLQNLYRVTLFAQIHRQHICISFYIFPTEDVLLLFIFCGENPFLIVFSRIARGNLQYVCYFSFSVIFFTNTCILIHIGDVNQWLSQLFQKFTKFSSILRKYFIFRYAFTLVHGTKNKNLRFSTRWFPMNYPYQFGT